MSKPYCLRNISALGLLLVLAAGCGGSRGGESGPGAPAGTPTRPSQNLVFDPTPIYRQMGMIARGLPIPFLGRVTYVASADPEVTHAIVTLSFSNNSFQFERESDSRFRARYTAILAVEGGGRTAARSEGTETVVVTSYRETTRGDESVIFQETLDVPPGEYSLVVGIRDENNQRSVEERIALSVPRFTDGTLSSAIPVLESEPRELRDSLPQFLVNPKAMVVFGRDSTISLYLEQYSNFSSLIGFSIHNERGRLVWSDTLRLEKKEEINAQVVNVPISRIGIGQATLSFTASGSADSVKTGVFVGFGEDLPVATYEEMINYLRYFAAPFRLQRLTDASAEDRPDAWAEFVRETDSNTQTAEHEDLREYFGRLVRANARFREEVTPGWLSDRGRVYISLGEPDQIIEPRPHDYQRNNQQLWDYRRYNMQLVFYDQTGTGRWRLTQTSNVRFESEFRRRLR